MADKKYKDSVGQGIDQVTIPATQADHIPQFGQIPVFTPITENQHGTHPAFANQTDLNAWLLGNSSSGGATTLNSPEPIIATSSGGDSIDINWTDTNS